MMQLSARSRTTSISNSFHPSTDCSTKICPIGLAASPRPAIAASCAASLAMPPPVPPSVNDGRTIAGNPTTSAARSAASTSVQNTARGISSPIFAIACANSPRSSAFSIAATLAPISWTPNSLRTPRFSSSSAQLSAVCPPIVGNTASGRSRSITRRTLSHSTGSMYTASAVSGSVMIVAGFELTRITLYPSARSARHACTPE